MKIISQINFSKSIDKKWLIYKESYLDKFDTLIHILISISLFYSTYATLISQKKFNENERFFIYLFILGSLVAFFYYFQKINRKKIENRRNKKH